MKKIPFLITIALVPYYLYAQTLIHSPINSPSIIGGSNNTQNNYFTVASDYIESNIENVFCRLAVDKETKDTGLIIFPKNGNWIKPFVEYPIEFMKNPSCMRNCSYSYFHSYSDDYFMEGTDSIVINHGKKLYNAWYIFHDNDVCNKDNPYFIKFNSFKNGFVIFGDHSDKNKWYAFNKGQIVPINR